jgi:hypothetical protein
MKKFLMMALMIVMALSIVGGAQAAVDPNQQATADAQAAKDKAAVEAARACFGKLQTAMAKAKGLKPGESSTTEIVGCYTLTESVTEDNGGPDALKIGPNANYCRNPVGVSEVSIPLPLGRKLVWWRIRTTMRTCWNESTSNIVSMDTPQVQVYTIFPWSITVDDHHSGWVTQPTHGLGTSTSTVIEKAGQFEVGRVSWTHYIDVHQCGAWEFHSETAQP